MSVFRAVLLGCFFSSISLSGFGQQASVSVPLDLDMNLQEGSAGTAGFSTPSPSLAAPVGAAPKAAPVKAPLPDPSATFSPTTSIFAGVAGIDISGASSTGDQAVFHGSAVFDVPLTGDAHWIAKENSFWVGGQVKIAGIAQPTTLSTNIGSLASTGTYLASALNATPDKIVQSVETSVDVAYQFRSKPLHINSLDTGVGIASDSNTFLTYTSLSGIVNLGAITPVSASQVSPPIYTVTSQIYSSTYGPKLPTSCNPALTPTPVCYVTFVPNDRNRFYRHYEAGLRLKTYGRDFTDGTYRFPAIVDLTVGQNEYVTGGQARNFVLHIGGWLPVPKLDGVYLFGSMDTVLSSNISGTQLLLIPAPSTVTNASASVTPISVPQPNRDRYMLGFGVDLYHLIPKLSLAK